MVGRPGGLELLPNLGTLASYWAAARLHLLESFRDQL